nr:iron-containing alcohol dehydrogenase [Paenibacillus brevis]
MSTYVYYVPPVNLMGKGCLKDTGTYIQELDLKKTLVVTDKFLVQSGIAGKVTAVLDAIGLDYALYDDVKPNPTCHCDVQKNHLGDCFYDPSYCR